MNNDYYYGYGLRCGCSNEELVLVRALRKKKEAKAAYESASKAVRDAETEEDRTRRELTSANSAYATALREYLEG